MTLFDLSRSNPSVYVPSVCYDTINDMLYQTLLALWPKDCNLSKLEKTQQRLKKKQRKHVGCRVTQTQPNGKPHYTDSAAEPDKQTNVHDRYHFQYHISAFAFELDRCRYTLKYCMKMCFFEHIT